MTVSADRTVDNQRDVSRKYPTTTLAEKVLTAAEGVVVESLTGPGIAGTVELSQAGYPGKVPALILAHDGAGAFEAGGAAPAALPVPLVPTHFTWSPKGPNGKATLTEANARDYSGSTLVVFYHPDQPEAILGGQTDVFPTDI